MEGVTGDVLTCISFSWGAVGATGDLLKGYRRESDSDRCGRAGVGTARRALLEWVGRGGHRARGQLHRRGRAHRHRSWWCLCGRSGGAEAAVPGHVDLVGRQHRLAERRLRPPRTGSPPSRPSTAAGSTWPQRLHHNAVVVQVRPTADAFWPSPYEPWSQYLTGVRRAGPGLGPAGLPGRRGARARTWSSTPGSTRTGSACRHPAAPGPTWAAARTTRPGSTRTGRRLPADRRRRRLYYNPGIPEVREFVEDAMLDASRATTSTACTSTTTSTRTRRRAGLPATTRRSPQYGAGLRRPGRLAARQHRPAGPGDGRPHQGGQAVGEVRRQPVRHLAQRQPPTRSARTPPAASPTTPSPPTPASGSSRAGSTTSRRSSTGTSASPAADYAKLVPWWADVVARHRRAALHRPGRLQDRRRRPTAALDRTRRSCPTT